MEMRVAQSAAYRPRTADFAHGAALDPADLPNAALEAETEGADEVVVVAELTDPTYDPAAASVAYREPSRSFLTSSGRTRERPLRGLRTSSDSTVPVEGALDALRSQPPRRRRVQ